MDLFFVLQIAKSVLKELSRFRYLAILIGSSVAFFILVTGMFWQEKYEVNTTLYADRQNIIQPLLEGQASVTNVEAQRQVVTDIMLSRRILEEIVDTENFTSEDNSAAQRAEIVSQLQGNVKVRMLGANYIGVSYADVDPQRSFNVVTRLVDYFIKESSENKRSESKQAFQFIDKQAAQYKEQLREAETRLKRFNASNVDGSEQNVQTRIESLRTTISNVELDLEQANVRIESLSAQVNEEDRFLSQKAKASGYQERIAAAVAELDTLRLSLTDNHPDVISMIQHIESLRAAAAGEGEAPTVAVSGVENPVYDELRGQLAAATVESNSVKKRLSSLQQRLESERERGRRIAERNAELAELTRDYDVTKQLYEELLERKEKARLSMTLDIEGQGVSYKIQEPPKFPLTANGLRFLHFVILGVILGVGTPIALVVMYVMLDPRIRVASSLENDLNYPVLVEVPHLRSAQTTYAESVKLRNTLLLALCCLGLYVGIAALFKFSGLS